MDRNQGSTGNTGSEDNREAQEHVRQAAENRDALEAERQRVDSTAPASVDEPIRGIGGEGGMQATPGGPGTGVGSEDTSRARANLRSVEEDSEALREQARRVDASAPSDVNRVGPPDNDGR